MSQKETALQQIRMARMYTNDLLRHIDDKDWFRQPAGGVTHIAWQVGHLAAAQYSLTLRRLRGGSPDDEALISPEFRKRFGKGSIPATSAADHPTPTEIRDVFQRVHRQALKEVGETPEDVLEQAADQPPHPMFQTKLGALHWAAQHEFIHIGQMALLRRLSGAEPLR